MKNKHHYLADIHLITAVRMLKFMGVDSRVIGRYVRVTRRRVERKMARKLEHVRGAPIVFVRPATPQRIEVNLTFNLSENGK